MPPLRTPDQRQTGLVSTLIYVVLLTIVTTVATNYAIVRFALIPAPAKPVAGKPVAPVKPKVTVNPGASATAPAADDADAMRQVTDSATSVLNTIDAIRTSAGPGFVGPNAHTGLDRNFNLLTAAANKVVNAPGNSPAAEQQAAAVFTRALDATIRNAVQISQRATESAESVQISAQVASALGDIRSSLP